MKGTQCIKKTLTSQKLCMTYISELTACIMHKVLHAYLADTSSRLEDIHLLSFRAGFEFSSTVKKAIGLRTLTQFFSRISVTICSRPRAMNFSEFVYLIALLQNLFSARRYLFACRRCSCPKFSSTVIKKCYIGYTI